MDHFERDPAAKQEVTDEVEGLGPRGKDDAIENVDIRLSYLHSGRENSARIDIPFWSRES